MTSTPLATPGGSTPADLPYSGHLPLGSWSLRVRASRSRYLEVLGSLFRQDVLGRSPGPGGVDADLVLRSHPRGVAPFEAEATEARDGTVAGWEAGAGGGRELFTGRMRVVLHEDDSPVRIDIDVREPQLSERAFRDHLLEVMVTLLAAVDRYYVHAAAVELDGRVNVFVGEGSFGKTSVTLRLAQAGATVLSEDHVLFTETPDGFVASGCQETARLTPPTELFLFGEEGLSTGRIADDGKKEFRVADVFRARPYDDARVDRLFFNRIGERFAIRPLTGSEALLRLVYMTKGFYRWSRPAELDAYLASLQRLVGGPELLALELSPRLSDIDRLVEFVTS